MDVVQTFDKQKLMDLLGKCSAELRSVEIERNEWKQRALQMTKAFKEAAKERDQLNAALLMIVEVEADYAEALACMQTYGISEDYLKGLKEINEELNLEGL